MCTSVYKLSSCSHCHAHTLAFGPRVGGGCWQALASRPPAPARTKNRGRNRNTLSTTAAVKCRALLLCYTCQVRGADAQQCSRGQPQCLLSVLLRSKFFVSCGDRSRHRPITFEISAKRVAAGFMSLVAVSVTGVGQLRFESVQIAIASEFIATKQVAY